MRVFLSTLNYMRIARYYNDCKICKNICDHDETVNDTVDRNVDDNEDDTHSAGEGKGDGENVPRNEGCAGGV